MRGITEWDTPQGLHVVRLHYTADPEKRKPEWKDKAMLGMPQADWKAEYEIDFDVVLGRAYFPEFRSDFHVASGPIQPIANYPIGGGWDFGLTPATVHVQLSPKGQILVLHPESQSWDAGIKRHGGVVQKVRELFFPGFFFKDYGDPAGGSRAQTDEKTCFEILATEYSIHVAPGPVTQPERDDPFRDLLTRTTSRGEPMFLVDPRCKWLISALSGGYCHKQVMERYLDEPEKNEYSHIVDALLYVVARLLKRPERRVKPKNRRRSGQL